MRFLKRDLAKQLTDLIQNEQKQLAGLQKKLDSIRPKWTEKQDRCVQLAAMIFGLASTYAPGGEVFFRPYEADLNNRLRAAIIDRDAIIGTLPGEIEALKNQISKRLSIISGTLGSFISGVVSRTLSGGSTPQCSPEFQKELIEARKKAEETTDPAELLSFIQDIVEKVEIEDLQFIPLLKLDTAIEAALSVAEPVEAS